MHGHKLIAHIIKKLVTGYFPDEIWEPLHWNILIVLYKDPDNLTKLRPIGIGLALRQLMA